MKLLGFRKQRTDDTRVRFGILRRLGRWVMPSYRFVWPQLDWWNDAQFNSYLERTGELEGMNTQRRWMVYQLARLVAAVPGDTAECGVYKGFSSYLICKANQFNQAYQRTHFLFDSFEGLSAPSDADGGYWIKGDLTCGVEMVRKNLSEFPAISFQKGWIPDRFKDVANRRFAFVHVDVDLYQPTLDSIEFFYGQMNPGGIIVCDDYGFTTCPGATRAVEEFLADKPEKMIPLSSGGGFLIKGCETAKPYPL